MIYDYSWMYNYHTHIILGCAEASEAKRNTITLPVNVFVCAYF